MTVTTPRPPPGPPPPAIATLLANRGIPAQGPTANAWLGAPGRATDPALMPGLAAATERIARACRDAEHVGVIADYDVDGVTAATILDESLTAFGARPNIWLPDRFIDGYGPSERAVRHLANAGATLLITVDCGISAVAELELASELGMDCVILDHHEPPDRVPPALAIVNPKLPGSEYGSEPAACAIAFKAMREVASVLGTAWKQAREHLALAAMGSVCDMVPLRGEQRDLIRVGLPILRRTRRPGLRAIASVAGFALERVTEHECGWRLGPRINAAGRIEHAREAFAVLRASTAPEAMVLATRLEEINTRRKAILDNALAEVASEIGDSDPPAVIVAASPAIAPGVAGLVAGRLAQERLRPALAFHLGPEQAVGSARGVGAYSVIDLLRRHEDLFDRLGGHHSAAGCTLRADRLPELARRLADDAERTLDAADRVPHPPEAELDPAELAGDAGRWLAALAPFGQGNPQPRLRARGARIIESRGIGGGAHLSLRFEGGVRGVAFGQQPIPGLERADIVYVARCEADGRPTIEIVDLRPA